MTIGLLLTSFALGLRHGIDWDHIAAISDMMSNTRSRRRGLMLSMLYAVGHATVVFVLGAALIIAGRSLPDGITVWMSRVVGLTLVFLGASILIQLVRKRRDFRLQSRWMLIINGAFSGLRRVRGGRADRHVDLEHEHDHSHIGVSSDLSAVIAADTMARAGAGENLGEHEPDVSLHTHRHHHRLALPSDPEAGYGGGTATGIGMLHGVGVESPTQIALFVASTSVAGAGFGMLLLVGWIVGLIFSNFAVALLAGFGLLNADRNFRIYAVVAVVVALTSIIMGLTFTFGIDVFPEIAP